MCGPTSRWRCRIRATARATAFTQLVDYIYKVLTQPDAQPPALPQTPTGKRVRDQRQMHYQMLPHARPGGIAGLLELLLDHNGKDDIYRLADDLAFEIDDLLPIVDAAQLLGFLTVTEGDAEITPAGAEYANSEILRQKELFRKAAVDKCAAAAADRARHRSEERPHRPRGVLPRHAGRAVHRRGDAAAAGDGDQLGPLRGAVRLRRLAPPIHPAGDSCIQEAGHWRSDAEIDE